jgi:Domain of unknown function (DUF1990)
MDWLGRWMNADLARWESRPFSLDVDKGPGPTDHRDNHERVVGIEPPGLPTPHGIAHRIADAILRFDVFPPRMLTPVLRRTPIEAGDTVGLRYFFLPGLHIFFAARVIDRFEKVIDNRWHSGFTYRTLIGHPECGEETFSVEKDLTSGQVTAALRSWSRPGLWIAMATHPIIRRLQLGAAGAALDHLERLAHPLPEGEAPAEPWDPGSAGASPSRRNLRTGLLRSDVRW